MDSINQVTSNTHKILSPVVADVPVQDFQWYHKSLLIPHEPIRHELATLRKLCSDWDTTTFTKSKFNTFFKWYNTYIYKLVHHHHDTEEKVFFPWLESRMDIPKRYTEDHETLISRLDDIRDLQAKYANSNDMGQFLEELKRQSVELEESMIEHLNAEEEMVIPALRDHFTEKEHDATVDRIMKSAAIGEVATMLPWILSGIERWGGQKEVDIFFKNVPLPIRFIAKGVWVPNYTAKREKLFAILLQQDSDIPMKIEQGCCITM